VRIVVVGVYSESLLSFRGDMLRAMVDAGHQVLAMAPEEDATVRSALNGMGVQFATVPLRRTGMNPFSDGMTTLALARAFRRFRADAILVYAAKPVIYGSIAGWLARVPLRAALITGAGAAFTQSASWRRRLTSAVVRSLYLVGLACAHLVFFQNPDDERGFRARRLLRRRHRVVIVDGSGVDIERFPQVPQPPAPVTFLMMSRLLREKGVEDYAAAAAIVRTTRADLRIQLVGGLDPNPAGISSTELDAIIAAGSIEYLGVTRDVRPLIAQAHVCVLPSYYGEGVPRSLLEGMAMGRAILTTDVAGCRETVQEGRNGILVPPRDPARLASAMLGMAGDPALLQRMGDQSRSIAEARFDVRKVNRAILGAMGLA
jgi:glycosyltransferase involved in cell wall biosynthesis